MRPSTGKHNEAWLVQRYFSDNAYNTVRAVYENMDAVTLVADAIEEGLITPTVVEEKTRAVNVATGNYSIYHTGRQGETSVTLPEGTECVNGVFWGGVRVPDTDYTFTPSTRALMLNFMLNEGDVLTVDLGASTEGNTGNIVLRKYIHNQYTNSGYAFGDGTEIMFQLPQGTTDVVDVFHNGIRLLHECNRGCYYAEDRRALVMFTPLGKDDTLVIKYKEEI